LPKLFVVETEAPSTARSGIAPFPDKTSESSVAERVQCARAWIRRSWIVGRQLIRSATSTAANYRAACRSKSPDDFVSKICTVCEESDEAQFWFDLAIAASVADFPELKVLFSESTELVRIFTASRTTAKENQAKRRAARRG